MMSLEPQILFREETDLYVDRKNVWIDVTKGDCKSQQGGQKQDSGKGEARGDPAGGVTSMSVEGVSRTFARYIY